MENEPVVTPSVGTPTDTPCMDSTAAPSDAAQDKPHKRRFDWGMLLFALVLLIIGVVILIQPDTSSVVLVYVVSALIALAGVVRVILYFARNEGGAPFSFGGLTIGLSLLAIGVFMLFDPAVLMTILHIALGCVLVFSGFASLQSAMHLIRFKLPRWYVPLAFALLSLACCFVALANPFGVGKILMIFLGVALCVQAVFLLVLLFLFRNAPAD